MKKLIHETYRKIKNIIKIPYHFLCILNASRRKAAIKKMKKYTESKKIKVGFIVQMPEIWDKEAPVYEAMSIDKRFEVSLIIVPHYNLNESKLESYGEEKEFFMTKYPKATFILLKDQKEMIIDVTYDYIFYQRCWEGYLPKQLRCKNVIKYAMTCYIPYCYHCAPVPNSYYQKDFFWYLSKFYCCSMDQYEEVSRIGNIVCQYEGFPVIDSLRFKEQSHARCKILWTPRWSDDPSLGGTSFNLYKYNILEIEKISEHISLTLRPHPLTFENAVRVGWMTVSEVEEYKDLVFKSGAAFDENKIIEDTFFDTDILITDFSSAMVPFFLSGKPIIYCSSTDFEMTDTFRKIMNSVYVANSWNEVLQYVTELINGRDVLFEKRKEVITSIRNQTSSVERIINDLVESIQSN